MRARTNASVLKTTSASQIKARPVHRVADIVSWFASRPHINCREGIRYCSSPMVTSGSRWAAVANINRVTAVITPDSTVRMMCGVPRLVKLP